jgi:hypothetical protein
LEATAEGAVKLRRWLILIALIAAVLSTAKVYCISLPSHGSHYRSVDFGFEGTPFSCRFFECHYRSEGNTRIFGLINGRGVGPKFIDQTAGTRIVFGDVTEPRDTVPAIWLRRRRP